MNNVTARKLSTVSPLDYVSLTSMNGETFTINKATRLSQLAKQYLNSHGERYFVIEGVVYTTNEVEYERLGSILYDMIYDWPVTSGLDRNMRKAAENWASGTYIQRVGIVDKARLSSLRIVKDPTVPELQNQVLQLQKQVTELHAALLNIATNGLGHAKTVAELALNRLTAQQSAGS